jgi:hypothetical protein
MPLKFLESIVDTYLATGYRPVTLRGPYLTAALQCSSIANATTSLI